MRKLIVGAFASLDGIMQAPGGPEEDPTNGFTKGGWTATYWDQKMFEIMGSAMQDPFDLVLGRKTYDIFAAHWPFTGDETGALFDRITKYVATHRPEGLTWQNSQSLGDDVVAGIRKLKAADGKNLLTQGSSTLISQLWSAGLVDEFLLWTFPVVLGHGKRVFGEGSVPGGLKLLDTQLSTTGVIVSRYAPAGEIPIGSFALEEPTPAELERRANWS